MRIEERDKQTAHAIAKMLGIDLEPWQDFMLQHMLAGYRQPDPPAVAEAEPEDGPPWCGAGHPSGANVFCGLISGHRGDHQASDVDPWSGGAVPDRAPSPGRRGICEHLCPDVSGVTCERARHHVGRHEAGSPGTMAHRIWM